MTYWIVWVIVFVFGCMIFLNFIIAEVSASYANIKDQLDSLIYRERAKMVREVEDFYTERFKDENKDYFPEYVIIREADQ